MKNLLIVLFTSISFGQKKNWIKENGEKTKKYQAKYYYTLTKEESGKYYNYKK